MLRRNKINVMATHNLQLKHHFGQLFRPGLFALAGLADVVVLTKNTAKVAHREKDRSATFPTAQTIFLPEMGEVAAHSCVATRFACRGLVRHTVHAAIARANQAIGQLLQTCCGSPSEFAKAVQLHICGFEIRLRGEKPSG